LHRKIVSKSFKFIKIALKLLQANNNKISFFHFSPVRPKTTKTNSAQSSLRAAGRNRERAGGGASLGAVTGPLAGARAPQRVSTPPSSGLAAAPLGRAQRAASPGAVAAPLVGVRVPQRVSTPPSSGLAAAPPWPSLAKIFPGSVFFSLAGETIRPVIRVWIFLFFSLICCSSFSFL